MGLPGLGEKDAKKVRDGNLLLFFTARVCRLASQLGIPWVIENPLTSRAWKTIALRKLQRLSKAQEFRVDFCQYGELWLKPTKLLSPFDLSSVVRTCSRSPKNDFVCSRTGKRHHALTGTDSAGVFWTRRAQPYPLPLCRALAQIIGGYLSSSH